MWMASPGIVTTAQWQLMHAWLDQDERARAARFLDPEDQRTYVLAHSLRRMGLSQALKIPVSQVSIARSPAGIPIWQGDHPCPLYFSHAHAHGLAVFVITGLAPLGIDVEALYPAAADLELLHAWMKLPPVRQRDSELGPDPAKQFLFYWTVLEAFWKAAGTGLVQGQPLLEYGARALQGFEVSGAVRGQTQRALAIPLQTPSGWMASVVTMLGDGLDSTSELPIRYRQINDFDWNNWDDFTGLRTPPVSQRQAA